MSTNRSTISIPPRQPEMVRSTKNDKLELGIELCLELAIALYQLGAEQMDLPHSFGFGLFLWIVATVLAIRVFWIFPGIERLKPQLKVAIASVAIAALIFVSWTPVTKAYRRAKERDSFAKQGDSNRAETKTQEQTPEKKNEDKKKDVPNTPEKKIDKPKPALRVNQESHGDNSPNVVTFGENSPATVTINPPQNPNAPVTAWDFNGGRRITQPGKTVLEVGNEFGIFNKMVQLQTAKDWKQLLEVSDGQIKKTPDWLTPYLFSGVALLNLGDREKGIERLKHVKKMAGGNDSYADADRLLGILQPKN